MIQEAIKKVVDQQNLNFEEAKAVMEEMMNGEATMAQMGGFLTALRSKGETIDEITACASVMREKAIKLNHSRPVIEIVGTGGDGANTFNISTTTAFVVAAGGVPVAKHGNRGVSSKSGAADVLENLGINLNLTAKQSEEILTHTDICFMFAQAYHTSMKNVAPVRKEMGIRTIFNLLGPLSNPAGATMQLLGVYNRSLVEPLAEVLKNLGVVRGLVVCGSDGLDEATLTGPTHVCEIRFGELTEYDISPEDFGLARCELKDLAGGTPEENAQITMDILSGNITGPKKDIVLLNAALALYLGIDDCSIIDCLEKARQLLESGKALEKLKSFVKASQTAKAAAQEAAL